MCIRDSSYPALRDPSDKVYRTLNYDGTYDEIVQPQAAAVVLDYRTGELKAIVGSRTRPTARKTLNRATDMKMPVGSAIKPIAVYAPALEMLSLIHISRSASTRLTAAEMEAMASLFSGLGM